MAVQQAASISQEAEKKIIGVSQHNAILAANREYYEHIPAYTDQQMADRTRESAKNAINRWDQRVCQLRTHDEDVRLAWGRVYTRAYHRTYRARYAELVAQEAAQAPAERVIFRCQNKKCGNAWANEYYSNENGALFSVQGIRRVYLQTVSCPKCQNNSVKYGKVIGTLSDRKCDARCLNAKGPDCSCSCNGANHGMGLLAS